jgi:hypothetical protein
MESSAPFTGGKATRNRTFVGPTGSLLNSGLQVTDNPALWSPTWPPSLVPGRIRSVRAATADISLLIANPPKGGDAEPRGYRDFWSPRPPGRQHPDPYRLLTAFSPSGFGRTSPITANPSKGGDAKLRGYRGEIPLCQSSRRREGGSSCPTQLPYIGPTPLQAGSPARARGFQW